MVSHYVAHMALNIKVFQMKTSTYYVRMLTAFLLVRNMNIGFFFFACVFVKY